MIVKTWIGKVTLELTTKSNRYKGKNVCLNNTELYPFLSQCRLAPEGKDGTPHFSQTRDTPHLFQSSCAERPHLFQLSGQLPVSKAHLMSLFYRLHRQN